MGEKLKEFAKSTLGKAVILFALAGGAAVANMLGFVDLGTMLGNAAKAQVEQPAQ